MCIRDSTHITYVQRLDFIAIEPSEVSVRAVSYTHLSILFNHQYTDYLYKFVYCFSLSSTNFIISFNHCFLGISLLRFLSSYFQRRLRQCITFYPGDMPIPFHTNFRFCNIIYISLIAVLSSIPDLIHFVLPSVFLK